MVRHEATEALGAIASKEVCSFMFVCFSFIHVVFLVSSAAAKILERQ